MRWQIASGFSLAVLCFVSSFAAAAAAPLAKEDQDIVKDAVRNLQASAQESRLARDHADSDGVKHFAELLVGGNEKMVSQLQDLCKQHDFDFNDHPFASSAKELEDLGKLHGKEFDSAYLDAAIGHQESLLAAVERGKKDAKDGDLRDWCDKKLSVVKEHLANAKELRTKIEKK